MILCIFFAVLCCPSGDSRQNFFSSVVSQKFLTPLREMMQKMKSENIWLRVEVPKGN